MNSSRRINVSVIIPFYNNQDTILRCLRSVESQSYGFYEVILVNDGSTDNSLDLVTNEGYKVVSLERNSGSAAARNEGLKLVSGDLVAFLDADDYWEEMFLETTVDFFVKFQDLDVVSTAQRILYDGIFIRQNPVFTEPLVSWQVVNFWKFWAEHDFLMTGSVVFRAQMIESVGFQNLKLRVSQDLEYWSRLGNKARKWVFVNTALFTTDGLAGVKGRKWYGKYKARRKGIAPMDDLVEGMSDGLKLEDVEDFNRVVSRIASNYFLIQLLGGHLKEAKRTFILYNPVFLNRPSLRRIIAVFAMNRLGMFLMCLSYRVYDFIKNVVFKK